MPTHGSMTLSTVAACLIDLAKISRVWIHFVNFPGSLNSALGIDSTLPNNFGESITLGLSAITSLVTISVVGGLPFMLAMVVLGVVYYNGASVELVITKTKEL